MTAQDWLPTVVSLTDEERWIHGDERCEGARYRLAAVSDVVIPRDVAEAWLKFAPWEIACAIREQLGADADH